jgi:hypothetical protein
LTGAKLDGATLTRTRMPDNSIHKWRSEILVKQPPSSLIY